MRSGVGTQKPAILSKKSGRGYRRTELSTFTVPPSPALDVFGLQKAPKEESSERYFDAIQDTEAYVAANDDVIIAVFRGTSELSDWATNIEIIPRRVDESWGLKGEGCDVHMVRTARVTTGALIRAALFRLKMF